MQSGPINKGTKKSFIPRNNAEAKAPKEKTGGQEVQSNPQGQADPLVLDESMRVDTPKSAEAQSSQPTQEAAQPEQPAAEPQDAADLGMVAKDLPAPVVDKLISKDLVFGAVPAEQKEALEKAGAFFPETEKETLGDGVGPDGGIEVTPTYDTHNPDTKNIVRTHEVDKELLEVDPETGAPKIESYTPTLLAIGEGILPAGHKSVPSGASVIPEGYVATLGMSESAAKVEGHRAMANNFAKFANNFSGSSLAGIMNLPVVTQLAPILALGSVGFAVNQNLDTKRELTKKLSHLEQQEKKSENDVIDWTMENNSSYKLSAKNERKRLETGVRQANFQLASSGLLAASGTSAIVGAFAEAGVAGFAGMGAAAAAAPYLAGGAMVLGSGTMVFNSLAELKSLSKEKAELEAAQAEGKTHVDRAQEVPRQVGVHPKTGKPIVRIEALDNMISVPIDDRLKAIEKDQRKHRLLTTALSGGMLSIGNMVTGASAAIGIGTAGAGMLALAPAGGLLAYQSIGQLRELGKEKKELLAAKENGETMVERELQQQDFTYATERVPISTLLAENKKARNKHKLILTSVGTAGGAMALTMGAGFSLLAAAPLALVPVAVGAMLFPDKVKEFAGKVKSLVSGFAGEAGQTKRKAKKATGKLAEDFAARIEERLAGLKESDSDLFAERPSFGKKLLKTGVRGALRKQYGGFYHEMNKLVENYASSSNAMERQQYMMLIGKAIKDAPADAKPGLAVFQEEVLELSMDVEAQWTARDIALGMKSSVGKKVLADKRVASRVEDLGYKKENMPEMYRETLQVMDFERQISSLAMVRQQDEARGQGINPMIDPTLAKLQESLVEYVDSVNGDTQYDNDRWAYRHEVFKAGHHIASKENDLGVKLTTRFIDAAQRPENQDNLELILKEVGYAQQSPVTEQDVSIMANATRILETPVQLAQERPDEHVAKLQNAVATMKAANPEMTEQLIVSDATTSNGEHFKGMTAQEALAERTKLNAKFQAAKRVLKKESPEAFSVWESAGQKIRELAAQEPKEAPQPVEIRGPEARMTNAFLGLTKTEPELTQELGDAFAELNDPTRYEGMDQAETLQAQTSLNLKLQKIRKKLEAKQPELMALWDGARQEVEKTHFDRSMDHDFKDKVLAKPEVKQVAEQYGVDEGEVEGIYMAHMKSKVLNDPRDLQKRLADDSGEQLDEGKIEVLNTIDRMMLRTAAEVTNGGADSQNLTNTPPKPTEDPNVLAWLEQSPGVQNALNSEQVMQLAEKLQVQPQELIDSFLTLKQAEFNPILASEFNGRLEAGDMNTVRTYQIAQEVGSFIVAFNRPPIEVVEQNINQFMQGFVVKTVLNDDIVKQKAEELGVDASQGVRTYLMVDSGYPEVLAELKARSDKGDTAAAAELKFVTEVAGPMVLDTAKKIESGAIQVPPQEPPAAA